MSTMNPQKIAALLTLLLSPLWIASAQQRTLDKVIEHMDASKGLQITFRIADPELTDTIIGEYRSLGRCFHYTTDQMKAWYDGQNLWVYLDQSGEINLSIPMKEELILVNPLLALDIVRSSDFTLSEKKVSNGGVLLTATPKKKASNGLQKLSLYTDKTYAPTKLYLHEAGLGKPIEVEVLRLERGAFEQMKDKDYFRFTQNKLPGKRVIDLR